MPFLTILQILIVAFLGLLLCIGLSNLWAFRPLGGYPMPVRFPRVSILVPARNEEDNVAACVDSLLGQDYPDFEVIVLNDNSTDRTEEILTGLAARDARLKVIKGLPLPEGWVGANWASHQLSQATTSEVILFTDADTRHTPDALRHAVAALIAQKADFLSLVPYEETKTWAEHVTVPFFSSFSIFGLLPLAFAYRVNVPFFTAANGQFKLFWREVYERIGGHAAIRGHAMEDLSLVREIASRKMSWRLMNGGWHVRCRMYANYRGVLEGFSKNMFAGFDYRLLLYVVSWLWLETIFWEPLVVIFLAAFGVPISYLQVKLAVAAVAITLALWCMLYLRFRHPIYRAFLYPVTLVFIVIIAWRSLVLTLAGRTTWKDRTVVKAKVRFI